MSGTTVLLGPQRFMTTAGSTLRSLEVEGPVATITAGWEGREDQDEELNQVLDGQVTHQINDLDWQPSTLTQAPVMSEARSEARKTTTFATSSGRPNRPSGISALTNCSIASGFSRQRRSQDPPGKRIEPGATVFTRMLKGASSLAIALARLS